MSKKYFGTDGIRGRVGEFPITPDFVLKIGQAAGQVLRQAHTQQGRPAVLIGKDTRVSGYMLESALEAGLISAGVDVYLVGPLPTPAVAYLVRALRLDAGIVISASHNPYYDNGIKFFGSTGHKLSDALEHAIESALETAQACQASEGLGRAHRVEDAAGRYIEFCKSTFPNELDLRGLRVVVDAAHGAGYHVAPKALHELGAEVTVIGATPDGFNINRDVGATHTEALVEAVRAQKADVGLALDGDADRLIMVGASGTVYDGDQLLYVLAKDWLSQRPLAGVVGTLMTNMALEVALQGLGVGFARAGVGDRYVMEQLKNRGWLLGGESSGHLICLDRHSTGDGLIAALAVFAALRRAEKTLDEMAGELAMYPQKLINVRLSQKGLPWREHPAVQAAVAAADTALAGHGRLLLRASGTEPLVRVMVEARESLLCEEWANRVAEAVASATQS